MGEEGSEEEVERSFEEEFASVVAPGEGLEEVLKSLDEELQSDDDFIPGAMLEMTARVPEPLRNRAWKLWLVHVPVRG